MEKTTTAAACHGGGGDDPADPFLLLPEDSLIQILVGLPVVSLLRCKSVCKSWRDLIQTSFFIHLHTTFNSFSSSSKFGSFIVQFFRQSVPPLGPSSFNHGIRGGNSGLFMLSSPSDDSESSVSISGGSSNDQEEEEEGPVVVDDLEFDMEGKRIVGSCNGLVCVRDRGFRSKPDQVYLWNPVTRQCMSLPEESKTTIPRATSNLVGFGFDVETKDYKVVQFTGLKPRSNGNNNILPEYCFCRVQVYSSSTHSWRLLEGIRCLPGYPFQMQDSVIYLNGTCFFMAYFFHTERQPCLAENNMFIISFDFTKEIITPIPLPDHHRDHVLCLCSWGDDKIALFSSPNRRIFRGLDPPIGYWEEFNMWVLNYERGTSVNKDSWTRLHSFKIQLEGSNWFSKKEEGSNWYLPRGISNDGKFALLKSGYGDTMTLYNFATKELYDFATKETKREDFLFSRKVVSNAHAYKPSSVFIGGNSWLQGGAAAADRVIRNGATSSSSSR